MADVAEQVQPTQVNDTTQQTQVNDTVVLPLIGNLEFQSTAVDSIRSIEGNVHTCIRGYNRFGSLIFIVFYNIVVHDSVIHFSYEVYADTNAPAAFTLIDRVSRIRALETQLGHMEKSASHHAFGTPFPDYDILHSCCSDDLRSERVALVEMFPISPSD